MIDLSTTYMGMKLANPIVPSASPLSETLDGILRMEEAGASAVVMYSLFEEQITHDSHQLDHYLSYGAESFSESLSYLPELESYNVGPEGYLNLIRQAKERVGIPIIGSLNGISIGGWTEYAKWIEEAGADALELNVYYIPTDVETASAEVEQTYIDILKEVKATVSIPVAMKLSPYFSATANMAHRLSEAGADALVLFNRFYQPDFDLTKLEVELHLVLSSQFEMRLPMRWVAILYGKVPVDFAITSGVHTHEDVIKGLMAGANVTMMASELLRGGTHRITLILEEMLNWMEEYEYESVKQMQGSMSQQNVGDPDAFVRANYMKMLKSFSMF